MASELNPTRQKMKDRLIMEGCKVVERSWGHLVIMPNMTMALDYFRTAIEKYGGLEYDSVGGYDYAEFHAKYHMSPEYAAKYRKQFEYLADATKRQKLFWIIQDAIQQGDPRKVEMVAEISKKLVKLIYEIAPSLRLDVQRERAENGDIWDAGLIGAEDPRPCWDTRPSQRIKRGAGGDGAYRIIINTDTSFGRSDSENCLVLCAMINVLQQYSDVEIWVQQGWVNNHEYGHVAGKTTDGGNGMNGVTLFPAFRGSGLHPAQVMFWCGHPMRDSIFSNLINKQIGRTSSGCSEAAELDCDLYTRNGCFDTMPGFNPDASEEVQYKQLVKLAEWTAKQLSTVLLDENDIGSLATD